MNTELKASLGDEFDKISNKHRKYQAGWNLTYDDFKGRIIEESMVVISELKNNPYLSAKEISRKNHINIKKLKLIYKIIQRSKTAQSFFKKSENRDYFQVVDHYFNKSLYTVVFFVGRKCPSRCLYCPNVEVGKNGKRTLRTYAADESELINEKHIKKIFSDLELLKKRGTDILVKISGGLEPLTDVKTINLITLCAKEIGVPVKLFTNGLLLNSKARRKYALDTSDIRISLSTTDEDQYNKICFDSNILPGKGRALTRLKNSIKKLIAERDKLGKNCKIGFNSIILPTNLDEIIKLIDLIIGFGADYVDFKPDYFSSYDTQTEELLAEKTDEAKEYLKSLSLKKQYVNFTNSLSRSNIYWNEWQGYCDCIKQSDYKIFITPYGDCSPVHYGAFPDKSSDAVQYSIGKIDDESSLSDILSRPVKSPRLELKKLNPFELMLNLEIQREDDDRVSGIPLSCSPYHTSFRDLIPQGLFY